MPSIEKIAYRFFGQNDWFPRCLLGGLLCFIPILNFFAFGYLYRYANQIRLTRDLTLPAWDDWVGLFKDGLLFFVLALIFFSGPIFIGWLLSDVLSWVTFDIIGIVKNFPLSVALFFAPSIFMCALIRFQMKGQFHVLWNFKTLFIPIQQHWHANVFASIFLMGIFLLGLPLYGLAFFIGFSFMICYFSILYLNREQE